MNILDRKLVAAARHSLGEALIFKRKLFRGGAHRFARKMQAKGYRVVDVRPLKGLHNSSRGWEVVLEPPVMGSYAPPLIQHAPPPPPPPRVPPGQNYPNR